MPNFFIKLFNNDPTLLEKGCSGAAHLFRLLSSGIVVLTSVTVFVALGKAKRATFFLFGRNHCCTIDGAPTRKGGLGVDGVFWQSH